MDVPAFDGYPSVTIPAEVLARLALRAAYHEQDHLLSQHRGPNAGLRHDLTLAGTAIFNVTGHDLSTNPVGYYDGRELLRPDRRRKTFGKEGTTA